jgi:TRAP transporter TAXI family solute receptor
MTGAEFGPMSADGKLKVAPPRPRSRGRHGFGLWLAIIGFCVGTLVATYLMFVEPPPPRTIVIATGAKGGAYHHFAELYAEELRKDGLSLEVRETAGSVENLALLADDKSGVSLAIVQSGVAGPKDGEHCHALGSLFREPLWVFYRNAEPIGRLSRLAGKRLGVGPSGSGTYAVTIRLLEANGLSESASSEGSKVKLVKDGVAASAKALLGGELDAVFFVAAIEADYVNQLLRDDNVRLLSFDQQEAYHRKFRYLSPVTVPAGLVNLNQNLPSRDIALLAPTAMLVARDDLHPALVPLLLTIATRVHGKGDELSNPGEFPSTVYTDLPVSEEAKHFFKSGPPVLQRILPFWPASLAERAKVMLIPLIMLLMPLLRAAPPLVRWRIRRKVYVWYSVLHEIDEKLARGMSRDEVDAELARLDDVERQIAHVDVPLSYMNEFYHLRFHLKMSQQSLQEMRERKTPRQPQAVTGSHAS